MREKWIFHGDETFNLAPYQYPWAATMAEHSLANHWTPKEVPMGSDKACFERDLTSDERHLFVNTFASLTTSDRAIAENLCLRIYDQVKAAEIRYYIERQIAEEGIHSVSYQHVIEVLGLDQHETYSRYKNVPYIKQWFDFAREQNKIEDLLLFLIFYYALWEGVWFPTSFAAIYSLHRRNLMTGTGQQIQYIHRDETMHIGFGIKLITEGMVELGSKPDQETVHQLFHEAMKRLDIWAGYCIPDVLGYNASLHKQHARYLADKRLRQLGYEKLFRVEEALPWLDEMASIKKEKNFFESRVIEYQSAAGLKFDNDESIDAIANWR